MPAREERHISPDGLLTLLVLWEAEDVTIGFDGHQWHTHGDVLAASYHLEEGRDNETVTAEAATKAFVQDILLNRLPIAISRVAGAIQDVWVTDDPSDELKYKPEDEKIEFRHWDGTPAYLAN